MSLINQALVRIYANNQTQHIVGAGCLVSDKLILTCAHVISTQQEQPDWRVTLDFPLLEQQPSAQAKVIAWYPINDQAKVGDIHDLALLQLTESAPNNSQAAILQSGTELRHRQVNLQGFPTGYPDSYILDAQIKNRTARGLYQLDTDAERAAVAEGFSGSPVWDEQAQAVLGILVEISRQSSDQPTYMMPTEVILAAFPQIDDAQLLPQNPYRGLEAFHEQHQAQFYGRDAESAQLLKRVNQQPLLGIVGASGSGKSSLMLAGLLPRCRAQGDFVISSMRPGAQPFLALANSLVPHLQLSPAEQDKNAQQYSSNWQAQSSQLHQLIERILKQHPGKRLLLLIDQFEELFTQQMANREQPTNSTLFLQQLCDCLDYYNAAEQSAANCVIAFTLRADFIHSLLGHSRFADLFNQYKSEFISKIDQADKLRQIIQKPAQAFGVEFAPALVERLLHDVEQSSENLPLLEDALSELWKKQSKRTIQLAAYEDLGGIQNTLRNRANRFYAELNAAQQAQLRHIFVQLVHPGEGTEDTRQIVHYAQINQAADNPQLIKALADQRLVITNQKNGQQATVEIVHEALIKHWKTLQDWMKQDRDFRRWQNRLRQDMANWQQTKQEDDSLLRGLRLDEAIDYQQNSSYQDRLASAESDFIAKSQALRQQQTAAAEQAAKEKQALQQRNVRLLSGGIIASLLLAAIAGWFAWQSQQAETLAEKQKKQALEVISTFTYEVPELLANIPQTSQTTAAILQYNLDALDKIYALNPDDITSQWEKASNLSRVGDIWLDVLGDTAKAIAAYEQSAEIFKQLAQKQPNNTALKRDLSVSLHKLGDVQIKLGNTEVALGYYQQSLAIAQQLATADPDNAAAQRDLSVSLDRLGDVQITLGNTGSALDYYQQSLVIRQQLAAADPGNAAAQRDLSVSLHKLGDVQTVLGNTETALDYYQQSSDILKQLAIADPDNAAAQRDLSVSLEKLGDVQIALGKTETALDYYQQSSDILKQLATADPDNAATQRDLSVSLGKLGDVQIALGNIEVALDYYQQDLVIAQQLAAADPDNAAAQRDLSVSLIKLGDVQIALGKTEAALDYYQQYLAIAQQLATADPDAAAAQRDLSVSLGRLGDVQIALGKTEAALDYYQQYLAIAQQLATADPGSAVAQRDLFVSRYRLATTYLRLQQPEQARPLAEQVLQSAQKLAAQDPSNVQRQQDLQAARELMEILDEAVPAE